MAEKPARSRPPNRNSSTTIFDRQLTTYKDERRPVDIFMVDTGHQKLFSDCLIVTVDRYMLQVEVRGFRYPLWINKAYIFYLQPAE